MRIIEAMGIKLKELRLQNGYSADYVGKRFGVTRQTISLYELGKRKMNADMFLEMLSFYDVENPNDVINEIYKEATKWLPYTQE